MRRDAWYCWSGPWSRRCSPVIWVPCAWIFGSSGNGRSWAPDPTRALQAEAVLAHRLPGSILLGPSGLRVPDFPPAGVQATIRPVRPGASAPVE